MQNAEEECTGARVRVIDATLREGSQAPGVVLSTRASAEIATLLCALQVDAVECGHPAISDDRLADPELALVARQAGTAFH